MVGTPVVVEAFQDGPRVVEAVRLAEPAGAAAVAPVGELRPVRLAYPDRASSVRAHIDATAIVRVRAGSDAEARAILEGEGLRPIRALMPSIGLWLVRGGDAEDGLAVASRLAPRAGSGSRIVHAAPNLYLAHARRDPPWTPNDPQFPGQWFFANLAMPDAWAISRGDANTSVVVVDTGCDLAQPDLVSKLDPGKNVVDPTADESPSPGEDGNGHGTACAGLVGAATNNGQGVAGACPECRLRCVKLLTAAPNVPVSADVDAFQFALDSGATVVSNSWGFSTPMPVPQALADAIGNVFDNGRGGKGTLVVFAAGNADHLIAADELEAVRGVLTIGAINNHGEKTSFTNYGDALALVAPTGTLSTDISGPEGFDPGDYTSSFGGTSSACPVAAGIAGLVASAAPDRTAAELYAVLEKTARHDPYAQPDSNGHDPYYGYGIIDPAAALRSVLGLPDPSETAEPLPEAGPPDGGDVAAQDGASEAGGCAVGGGAKPSRLAWLLALAGLARRRRRR